MDMLRGAGYCQLSALIDLLRAGALSSGKALYLGNET